MLVKQLKNRYSDKNEYLKFFIGVDRPKMRVYDIDNPIDGIIQDAPVMDTTTFGQKLKNNSSNFKF